jgi:hypothetical protein
MSAIRVNKRSGGADIPKHSRFFTNSWRHRLEKRAKKSSQFFTVSCITRCNVYSYTDDEVEAATSEALHVCTFFSVVLVM